MTRGSQKYYLRPNGLVDNRYAENLLKKKQVIKVNDAYFNNIEVIKKDTKKKLFKEKTYPLKTLSMNQEIMKICKNYLIRYKCCQKITIINYSKIKDFLFLEY